MRLFIDTIVLVSTILFPSSTSAAFVRAAVEAHALVISDYVVVELYELRDEADRPMIEAAISSHCERIITADQDLLVLDRENLRIVSPGDFVRFTMAGTETE